MESDQLAMPNISLVRQSPSPRYPPLSQEQAGEKY